MRMLWVHVVKFPNKLQKIFWGEEKDTIEETSEQTPWTKRMHATLAKARSNLISRLVPFTIGISLEEIIIQL